MSNNPRKFEGEPKYVPEFWDRARNGEADSNEDGVFSFTITEEDVGKYPELVVGQRLLMSESPDGFVFSRIVSLPQKRQS